MKRKLLTPPPRQGEILLIPSARDLFGLWREDSRWGTAHQTAFFNPGVALKFLLLQKLPGVRKETVFIDTDRTLLEINLPPARPGPAGPYLELIKTDAVLSRYRTPPPDFWSKHFKTVEDHLLDSRQDPGVLSSFRRFKDILLSRLDRELLKETLAISFLDYFCIPRNFLFLSDLLQGAEFKTFFTEIYRRQGEFREIFNRALREYRRTFRFRYKNYPFPQLKEGELPFWLVKGGKRFPLFRDEVEMDALNGGMIFPRAVTLTLFLRLFRHDIFVHGVGGGNYEWVQDRLIERFYQREPGRYVIVSGTFLLGESPERNFPFFFYPPDKIKRTLTEFLTAD